MKDTFATLVRDSSARSFSIRTTAADAAILAVLGASAGCAAFFLGRETGVAWLRWATRALYAIACLVPIALFALVAAIPLLRR